MLWPTEHATTMHHPRRGLVFADPRDRREHARHGALRRRPAAANGLMLSPLSRSQATPLAIVPTIARQRAALHNLRR